MLRNDIIAILLLWGFAIMPNVFELIKQMDNNEIDDDKFEEGLDANNKSNDYLSESVSPGADIPEIEQQMHKEGGKIEEPDDSIRDDPALHTNNEFNPTQLGAFHQTINFPDKTSNPSTITQVYNKVANSFDIGGTSNMTRRLKSYKGDAITRYRALLGYTGLFQAFQESSLNPQSKSRDQGYGLAQFTFQRDNLKFLRGLGINTPDDALNS